MGWLWSSTPSTSATTPEPNDAPVLTPSPKDPSQPRFGLSDDQRSRIFGQPSDSSSASSTANTLPPEPKPRGEQPDVELNAFLNAFTATDPPSPSDPSQPQRQDGPHTDPTTPLHDPSSRLLPDGTLSIHPSTLVPSTMSCRQAFDQAFYCQSLGGKFNDIYRYGHLKDCNEQWGAFWFCMRVRTLGEKAKSEEIREFYREREERKLRQLGGGSERVWGLRTRMVERAFGEGDGEEEEGEKFAGGS